MAAESSTPRAKRNRIIAIAAGGITVVAIVLAFASGYLGLGWQWLRPAAELLLLAELVGLIVLERHQLFEPLHEHVGGMRQDMTRILDSLGSISPGLNSSGQVVTCIGPRQLFTARVQLLREALARKSDGPRILRTAVLSGRAIGQDTREVGEALKEVGKALSDYQLSLASPPDAPAHGWSNRVIAAVGTTIALDYILQFIGAASAEPGGSLNTQIKMFVRSRPEALLSPMQITDRDVVLAYDDELSSARWGLVLHGQQYVTLFAQWFDDRWAAISDRYLIYGRQGLNQNAVELIRKELEAAEAVPDHPHLPKSEATR